MIANDRIAALRLPSGRVIIIDVECRGSYVIRGILTKAQENYFELHDL
jgi:hypothetical protein